MAIQFLLYIMPILLVLIFWELSKIHTRIKKALNAASNNIIASERAQGILHTSTNQERL
jgi:hypothetical protein